VLQDEFPEIVRDMTIRHRVPDTLCSKNRPHRGRRAHAAKILKARLGIKGV